MTGSGLRIAGLTIAALVVLVSGVFLTRAGRPYGSALLTVHKLVDLGAVAVVGWVVYRAAARGGLSSAALAVIAVAAVLALATFASGGVLSASAEGPSWALWLHRAGGFLVPVLAGLVLVALGSSAGS